MARKKRSQVKTIRRQYSDEFKEEAVRMLLDGHSATSVAANLGLSTTSVLYRWKNESVTTPREPQMTVMSARFRQAESSRRSVSCAKKCS